MGRWLGSLIWACCVVGIGCGFDRSPLKGQNVVASPAKGNDRGSGAAHAGSGAGGGGAATASHSGGAGGTLAAQDASIGNAGAGGGAGNSAPDGGGSHSGTGGSAPAQNMPDAAVHDAGTGGHAPDASNVVPGSYQPCDSSGSCPDGQTCYAGNPSGPDQCGQSCSQDSDCTDYDGFDFTCYTTTGVCRIDCSSSGSQGACPAALACVRDATNNDRCRLRPPPGWLFQPCNIEHGDADCMNSLLCYRPDGAQTNSPGYCTTPCFQQGGGSGQPQCFDPTNAPAQISCDGNNVCRFECGQNGACPAGMQCDSIGNRDLCHYPLAP